MKALASAEKHLADLAADKIPRRDLPSAFHWGLIQSMATELRDAVHPQNVSPEQIDGLGLELYSMGIHVPPRDTAFFHAAVRKWLDSIKAAPSNQHSQDER